MHAMLLAAFLLLAFPQATTRDAEAMRLEVVGTGWLTLDDVTFAGTSATLTREAGPVLQQLTAMLKKHDEWRFEVQAHAERGGSERARQARADARAEAVVVWLTRHGIPASRLVPKGYAEPTADGRAHVLLRKLNEETEERAARSEERDTRSEERAEISFLHSSRNESRL